MAKNRTEHLRYRYGICLNDNCEKCKTKEVQQIAARKDFVCQNPECGKPLRECAPPQSFMDKYRKPLIAAAIVGALAIAAGVVFTFVDFSGSDDTVKYVYNDEEDEAPEISAYDEEDDSPVQDTEEVNPETPKEEAADTLAADTLAADTKEPIKENEKTVNPKPTPPQPSVKVPFGTYSGPANGLDGVIKVTKNYSLDLRNSAHETIELQPGDVITRTKFKNGELVSGYWQRGTQTRAFHR